MREARTNGRGRRVLVVDGEPATCAALSATLRLTGFTVAIQRSGHEALAQAARHQPDLIVLEACLPDLDGFEVARQLRSAGVGAPVLFLTARATVEDRIRGLIAGGDDYVAKPFNLEEVVLRIRAILRRGRLDAGHSDDGVLRYADLELDDTTHEVHRAGRLIDLSLTEYNLLRCLLANASRVVSKAQILDEVWSCDFEGDRRIIESYVYFLRRKLDTPGPPLIHTVRGVGYALRLPPDHRGDLELIGTRLPGDLRAASTGRPVGTEMGGQPCHVCA
jgi:two-component system OmpR family response regulator